MFRKFLILTLFCVAAFAQNIPQADCTIGFTITSSGVAVPPNPNGFDNRQKGCQVWAMTYNVSGFSAVNISLQSAANNAGAPSTWGTFSGQTIVSGANPNTSTTTAMFVVLTGYQPWIRVKLNSATGSGLVSGVAYGWASPSNSGGGGGGGGGNVTIVSPIGQALMAASVSVAIASDQSAVPSNTTQFAGVPVCNLQADISISSSGNTQIIAASGSKVITICHISISTKAGPEDISITQGTGSNCGSSTATLAGPYLGILGLVLDFPTQTFKSSAGDAICINQSASQAASGLVTYGQN